MGERWRFPSRANRDDPSDTCRDLCFDQLLERIIDRCRELNLRLADSEESTKIDFMVFLTVQTMNYLHSGRHRVAL